MLWTWKKEFLIHNNNNKNVWQKKKSVNYNRVKQRQFFSSLGSPSICPHACSPKDITSKKSSCHEPNQQAPRLIATLQTLIWKTWKRKLQYGLLFYIRKCAALMELGKWSNQFSIFVQCLFCSIIRGMVNKDSQETFQSSTSKTKASNSGSADNLCLGVIAGPFGWLTQGMMAAQTFRSLLSLDRV